MREHDSAEMLPVDADATVKVPTVKALLYKSKVELLLIGQRKC